MQRAQGGTGVSAPVVEVGVLPPPQGLQLPVGPIVLEPVDEVGGDGRDVIGQPERRPAGVGVRIEQFRVVVAVGNLPGQADPQGVQIRVVTHLRFPVARQDHIRGGTELGSRQQDLGHLEQQ